MELTRFGGSSVILVNQAGQVDGKRGTIRADSPRFPRSSVPPAAILPDPTRWHLLGLTADAPSITATVITTAATARCPLCEQLSTHAHSRSRRHPADLPWHGIAMRLVLHVRKFFCDNAACVRRVVTERVPGIVAPYARRTARLDHGFAVVGFAAGGEAGARVFCELGLAATPQSVLARRRAFRFPRGPTPRGLGVDDFAFRRRYGTILVDLERWWMSCPTARLTRWRVGSKPIPASKSSAATVAAMTPLAP